MQSIVSGSGTQHGTPTLDVMVLLKDKTTRHAPCKLLPRLRPPSDFTTASFMMPHVGLSVLFCATSLLTISLLALESFASPLPAPGRQCILNFSPNFADFPSRGRTRPSLPQILLKTNGQRLAFGLAPKPPLRRPWSRRKGRLQLLPYIIVFMPRNFISHSHLPSKPPRSIPASFRTTPCPASGALRYR